MWSRCNKAIEIRRRKMRQGKIRQRKFRQREIRKIRQGEIRQGEIWQRVIRQGEIRQREIRQRVIRQGIGGGRANDGQGGYGHNYRRHSARSPLLYRLRRLISLRFFIRCLNHLRSLCVSPVARFLLAADPQNRKSHRVDDPTTTRAIATQIRLKSWAYMVKDQLFPARWRPAMYPKVSAGPIVMPAPGYVPPITLAASLPTA
jgi:hypothetical protein